MIGGAFIRRMLQAVAPRSAATLDAVRARAHSHRLVKEWGLYDLNQKIILAFGRQVQEGPFAGLVLTPMCDAEHLAPFLLGVYESEIDEAWQVALAGRYAQIVDVGAKFGYYAVGLARAFPEASVVAFDTDPWARKALREVAEANQLTNVDIRGFCEPSWFNSHLKDGALIVSDCEGFEGTLFEQITTPALRTATLIVETHDNLVPGVHDRVAAVLRQTHRLSTFDNSGPRRLSGRQLDFLSEPERQSAQHEVRGEQRWLLASPAEGYRSPLRQPIRSVAQERHG